MNKIDIFVFGSNTAGRHGAGAALTALRRFGAIPAQGEGLQGRSYGIPTKDRKLRVLPLYSVAHYVERFLNFAQNNPELNFYVTRIGTGLAGYKDEDIAPMFVSEEAPENCFFDVEWKPWLGEEFQYFEGNL